MTIGSLGAGLLCSTIRWTLIDTLHHRTGIQNPNWNFAKLANRVDAFTMLLEIHYRYYQWHANSLIAILLMWLCFIISPRVTLDAWHHLVVMLLAGILYVGSRDTLRKYYSRSSGLLSGE